MSELFKRTHMCGRLNARDIGEEVTLNGWVAKQRDLGGLIFIDLRDKTGIVQVVFDVATPAGVFKKAVSLRSEYVIGIKGIVKERSAKNPLLPTGEIEVFAEDLVIYSAALTPPIYIRDDDNAEDSLRLKYRYIDLRKLRMQGNLTLRHRIARLTRDYFDSLGFTEVETPLLIKSTPEGARDYLVPSRTSPREFYALPQSPQLFKQLLMAGGTDRYMQIARCFRDEDLRADRQPEFTQIDVEMSFVDMNDVMEVQEGFLHRLFKEIMDVEIQLPLPRFTYEEALRRFGSDKPDMRFGFELRDLSGAVKGTGFRPFKEALKNGGSVRGICIGGGSAVFSRKDIGRLAEASSAYGAEGPVWIRVEEKGYRSSVNKFFSEEQFKGIADIFGAKAGDLILIASGTGKAVYDALGFLRRYIAGLMGLLDDKKFSLLWVTDFPMFERDGETGALKAMHHPFTHPQEEDIPLLEKAPDKVKACAYDIVLNGVELGGGSIRIHDSALQTRVFRALGLTERECEEKFGFLIEAFRYGVPPHGGIAYGFDRLAALLAGEKSIREVIAFPKNQNAECPVCGAPAPVGRDQLDELGLELK